MKRNYFFFDIDGTLTDNATHAVVPSANATLQQLRDAGHFVAIATGRAFYKTLDVARQTHTENFVCYGGGALVLNNQMVDFKPLDRTMVLQLLRDCDAHGIGYLLMLEDSDRVVMKDYRFLEQAGLRRELTTYQYEPDLQVDSIPEFYKVYVSLPASQEANADWIQGVQRLRMPADYLVIQYDAKREGILRMMERLHADPKDVVVFGDDTNDLVMFDPRWLSIAMGNAKEELKAKANYVTTPNVEDGIRNACLHFGWISND